MSSDKGSGIVLKESSTAKLIQSNTLSFTQRTCIVVENSTAQYIKSNTLTGGNNGIYTYLSTVNTISLNQCTDNSFGIYIKSSKADYINSNTISNEKNYGIRSTSSNIAHINSNTITNAKVYGIYSTNSQGQVMSNTVKSSGQYGMVFDSKATNQIYHNDFNNNTKGNILLQGKKSKVVSNISTPKTPEVKNTAYNKNKLSWEKIGSLKNYKVYRSTDNKSFTYIGLSKSNSFTDNKAITGVRYYYKICATNKASNAVLHSYYSSVKSGYTKGIAVVNNVVAKQKNSKKIQISWSTDISPESYIVYRSVNNSSFKQLATINGSLRKYIDTSISKGKTYTYKIKAISHNAKGKVISTALSKGAKITVTKSKN
jgi:parallel beta-helix repeat protein